MQRDAKASVSMVLLFSLSLAGYPLITVTSAAIGLDNRTLSIIFRAGFLGLAIWIFLDALFVRTAIFKSLFWPAYLSFFTLYTIRIFWDSYIEEVPTAYPPEVYFLFLFGVTLIPSFAFAKKINKITSRFAMVSTLVALTLVQAGFLVINTEAVFLAAEGQRVQTEALNAISYGALGGMTVVIGAVLAFYRTAESHGLESKRRGLLSLENIAVIFCIGLGLYTILLSGSRGPLLATLVAFSVFYFNSFGRGFIDRISSAGRLGLVILLFGILFVGIFSDTASVLFERVSASVSGREMSDGDRFVMWSNGFQQFLDNPIFGSGFEEKVVGFYPHNLPLEALMATGIFGGALWLAMFFIGLRRAFFIIRHSPSHAWIGVLVVYVFINSIFSGNLWNAGVLTHLMVALFAVSLRDLERS